MKTNTRVKKYKPRVRALKLATEVRKRLTQELKRPVKVIMFGSQARGDAKKDSDIDLLVIVPKLDNQIRKKISHATWEVGFEAGKVICAVPTTARDFEYYRIMPLYQAIRKEGVAV
ncbi:MAG: nucleotidyltransferase domain-containing protein [Chloroflexi bacterium]|nr:nucleotidyltransferase domain-containing protein [Chloroflexota bacterium]